MQGGVPYADIIILALIAGFILLRLRNVLGQGPAPGDQDFMKRIKPDVPPVDRTDSVVRVAEKILKNKPKEEADPYLAGITDTALAETLRAVRAKDPQFSATHFLDGAKAAFEMVQDGFAKGDKQALTYLLSEDILKEFSAEIDARAASEEKSEATLVAVLSKDITAATLAGSIARLTVTFTSEQVILVRNAQGVVIQGDPAQSQHVVDEWTFERDVMSKNPNWKIIDT